MTCMIRTNSKKSLLLVFKDIYKDRVRRRLDNEFWNPPDKWDTTIFQVLENIEACKAKIRDYIDSQFHYLSSDFLLRTTRLCYPIPAMMINAKARSRYNKYMLMLGSFSEREFSPVKLINRIKKELRFLNSCNDFSFDRLLFYLNCGQLSIHTLAFLYIQTETAEFKDRINRVISMASRLDIGETEIKFNKAKELLEDYGKIEDKEIARFRVRDLKTG